MKFSKDKVINYIEAFVGANTAKTNVAVFRFGDWNIAKQFLMDMTGIDHTEVPVPINIGNVWYTIKSCYGHEYKILIECDSKYINYQGYAGVYFRIIAEAADSKYLTDNKFARNNYAPDCYLCYQSEIHYVNYELFCNDIMTDINMNKYSGRIKKETSSFHLFDEARLNITMSDITVYDNPLIARTMKAVISELYAYKHNASEYLVNPCINDNTILAEFIVAYDVLTSDGMGKNAGIQYISGIGKTKGKAVMEYLYKLSNGKFDPEPELRTGGKKND